MDNIALQRYLFQLKEKVDKIEYKGLIINHSENINNDDINNINIKILLINSSINKLESLLTVNQEEINTLQNKPDYNERLTVLENKPDYNERLTVLENKPDYNERLTVLENKPDYNERLTVLENKPDYNERLTVLENKPDYNERLTVLEKKINDLINKLAI